MVMQQTNPAHSPVAAGPAFRRRNRRLGRYGVAGAPRRPGRNDVGENTEGTQKSQKMLENLEIATREPGGPARPPSMRRRPVPANGEPLAGVFEDVHASAPAVDQVQAAVLVGADVVRLYGLLAGGQRRDVVADLLGVQRIADVDRAQSGG
jgi:hypothetical protein